jgi:cytochrome c-type biogenesis protein CcmH/NrfG
MPETIVLLAVLLVAGAFVLAPLRRPVATIPEDFERDAAAVRHRVALEALRDVEADRRSGSLDERGYAQQLAEAEARAAMTRADLDETSPAPAPAGAHAMGGTAALFGAGLVGAVLVVGSWLPATGIANSTDVNEGLAAAQAAETARQAEIDRLLESLGADPDDPEALSDLADAYLAGSTGDDLARAAAALQVLLALEPDRADAYERLIGAYLRAGDFVNGRRALDSYEERETADPVEVAFFDGLIALSGENDPARARAAFDRFLELAPDDPRAEMIRGLRAQAEESPGSP